MSQLPSGVILSVQDLGFSYRSASRTRLGVQTLSNISFELLAGETLGVIGRNGSGKSTLLRVLAGILEPSEGTIFTRQQLKCGLLALGVGFMQDLTGRDNVIVSLLLQGFDKPAISKALPMIEEFADLKEAFYDRVKTYSAGMRARLTFSCALHCPNDVLLVDEVLSVGDGDFRVKARKALADKIAGDQTVVFVSHSEAAIQEFCDRAIWLDQGKVNLQGDVPDVLQRYRDTYEP